ncbi:hypothetical protein AZE42_08415 [Rhizopogon vesiculosus]|uniref:Uncharacterized protein n=1 Tax=Rhizopogon vesiculosus TaxID=180088 RepID=A0A1J8QIQ7_9AGAM|nr:hypothetical protein AZE42_08415 [Rhizopogon vesiculosus]
MILQIIQITSQLIIATVLLICHLILWPFQMTLQLIKVTVLLILWPFRIILSLIQYILNFILNVLGFTKQGVARDSSASRYQSIRYGGSVPQGSTFSKFQSYGANGA